MSIVDVNDWVGPKGRIVHRVTSVSPAPHGAMVLFVDAGDGTVTAFAAQCMGIAILEAYAERKSDGVYAYRGPHWGSRVVPLYQNAEGSFYPDINDEPDHWNGLLITANTSWHEVQR